MKNKLQHNFAEIIAAIDANPDRDGLKNTPRRAAEALAFLVQGYNQSVAEIIGEAVFDSDNEEMVVVKDIELYSLCEHHLLPIVGRCHIGYIPDGKVLGLSKIARIVNMFSRRLQIQENLTKQIADGIQVAINSKGVGVIIDAEHMCMTMRGVEKQQAFARTVYYSGCIKNDSERKNEFLKLLGEQNVSN